MKWEKSELFSLSSSLKKESGVILSAINEPADMEEMNESVGRQAPSSRLTPKGQTERYEHRRRKKERNEAKDRKATYTVLYRYSYRYEGRGPYEGRVRVQVLYYTILYCTV